MRLESHLLFREVNRRIHELTARGGEEDALGEAIDYVCECADYKCQAYVRLTHDEFARIAARPDYYVVARGHHHGDVELLVVIAHYAIIRVRKYAREPARTH